MKIYNYPRKDNISFGALNYKNFEGIKVPSDFKVALLKDNNNNVDCFVKSYFAKNNGDISVTINDGRLTEYGHCFFDYRQKKWFVLSSINNFSEGIKGVGSALHLTQIISMLENNIPETKLYSLGSAVNFHAKLGYKSDFNTISDIKTFLMDEIAMKHYNDEVFLHVISKLKKWYANSFVQKEKRIVEGNQIIDEFIRTINDKKLKYDDDYNIITGIKMILKREDVINNKEIYNNLFNKYGIDYQITD